MGRPRVGAALWAVAREDAAARSEEHTSELQSQSNLVCRLLLEKKKNKQIRKSIVKALKPTTPNRSQSIIAHSLHTDEQIQHPHKDEYDDYWSDPRISMSRRPQ